MEYYLPKAIKYGIRYKDFMDMTPKVFNAYRKANEEEEQKKVDLIDYSAWLNGLYVRRAIASCFSKDSKYPEKPFTEEEREKSFREENPDKAAAFGFGIYADAFNALRKSGE